MNENIIHSIIYFGHLYRQNHLGKYNLERVENDFWASLEFFLNHIFYQGRLDKVSEEVLKRAKSVLEKHIRNGNWSDDDKFFDMVKAELDEKIGKGKVGKGRDNEMVISVLRFLPQVPDRNITKYAKVMIEQGEIQELYGQLDEIRQIGDKIASFYLRDVVSLFGLENFVSDDFQVRLQPVDTWIRQTVKKKLKLVDDMANDKQVQTAIINLCKEHNVSPLLFNQGIWYMSYNALELLLEVVSHDEIKNIFSNPKN